MKTALLACIAVLLAVTPGVAAPLERYGQLPARSHVEISPDGRRLAFITTVQGQRKVVVQDLETKKVIGAVSDGGFKFRGLLWADPDNLIIVSSSLTRLRGVNTSVRRSEYTQGSLYDVRTRQLRPLISENAAYGVAILTNWPKVRTIEGKATVYLQSITFVANEGRETLFRTDVKSGRSTVVGAGDVSTREWVVDAEGMRVAEERYWDDAGVGQILLRHKDGLLRQVEPPEGYEDVSLVGLGRDGNSVLVNYTKEDSFLYAEISLETFKWSEPLTTSDISRLYFDPQTKVLIGFATIVGDRRSYTFFDPQTQKDWQIVQAVFSGQPAELESWTDDRRKLIVQVDSLEDGPGYVLFDLDGKKADWIGAEYDLQPEDISPIRPYAYTAADGTKITGYLTTPRGRDPKALPLIVLPHGGPASRDYLGFDWWSQALAARGYAVLQPNFRGSDGFGVPFMRAGYGQWGRKMQTDLSDGVRALVAEGVVDPGKVCIVGASYGGYAALAGATLDRGVYRCAVSVAGPSDLKRMLKTDLRASGKSALRYWSRFMGVDGVKDPDLADISPASQAALADIPILLIHGRDDIVVLYEQSEIMAAALKKAGKPVEFVTLEGEDHHLSNGETRQQMLQSIVTFVEKNNPAR